MKVIDSQLHVYERDCAAYPWPAATAGILARAKTLGMEWGADESAESTIQRMDAAGVDAAVLVQCATIYDFDNTYAIDTTTLYPDRFALVGRLDHKAPTIATDVAGFAALPGTVGVRAVASQHYKDALPAGDFEPMFKAAQDCDIAVCIYSPEFPREIQRVAETYPRLQLVLDHMCLNQTALAMGEEPFASLPDVLALAKYPNVAAKLSGLPSLSREKYPFKDVWPVIRPIVDAFGPERLMWGTDTTRTPFPYREEVDFLQESNTLSESEKVLIFGESLQRIFKWTPAGTGSR